MHTKVNWKSSYSTVNYKKLHNLIFLSCVFRQFTFHIFKLSDKRRLKSLYIITNDETPREMKTIAHFDNALPIQIGTQSTHTYVYKLRRSDVSEHPMITSYA